MARKRGRLDAAAWTRAALDVLAEQGIEGVRIESLARRLQVTKGSFYWHFKDRDALLQAMLDGWRQRATLELIDRLESSIESPKARFRTLLALPFADRSTLGADIELAVRVWGRREQRARSALAEVDELRVAYMTRLLVLSDMAGPEAQARAVLAYSYMRVARSLVARDAEDLIANCQRVLLGDGPELLDPITRS